ncbi:hypothetical protein [Streptomyces zaomyceticus]|uniref:Uncharacterized protein n=1 Tax=Streptomyces zaomyceticus TaxID=68286 RepID=A0ABZ1LEV4_9ACTN|nr:hypothetical protein OG237_12180 [Streptomyces zaomyceticus]
MSSPVPYSEQNKPLTEASGRFRWELRREGGWSYEVTGECPRCRCPMTKSWPYGQYTPTKGPFDRGPRPAEDDGPWFTRCTCASRHENRPAGEDRGCGAGFWIAFPPQGLPR